MSKKIYLDVDEEITSVIDRLKGESEADLALVVPKGSGLLQSVVNLKLLKREAEKLNKKISVVTSNKVGKTLAENVGLLVEGGTAAVPEDNFKADDSSQKPKDAEQESVLIEYKEEPKKKEGEEIVSFKQGKIPEDDEISIKETEEPEPEIVEKAVKKEDKPDLLHQKKGKKLKLNGFVAAVFLTFVALFIFGYIYIPRATINIKVAAEKKTFETDLTVDKNEPETKADRGLISGKFVELSKDYQKKFQATGKKEVGTKAKGSITVSNKYDSSPQTLVAGTRFQNSEGLIFKTTQQVNVPGATVSGGSLTAGTVSVAVEAENSGGKYNIAPTTFSVPGFAGTAKEGLIYGQSSAAMTGGESKEISVISQSDFNSAKESYEKEVMDEAKKELKEKAKDYSLADEATEVKLAETSSSPAVGAEASEFSLIVKVQSKGIGFRDNDLKQAYEKKVKDEAGTSREVIKNGFEDKKITITKLDFENGTLNLDINSTVFFGTLIDKKSLFTEISGQNEEKSLQYLNGLENVEEAKVTFWPGFLKRIPRIEKHVSLKTEAVEKQESKETKN